MQVHRKQFCLTANFGNYVRLQTVRRNGARRIAAVHAGFLDMLQDARNNNLVTIAQGIHIDLNGVA